MLMAAAALTAVEVSSWNPVRMSAAVPVSWVRACRNELPGCRSAAPLKRQAGSACAVGGCALSVRLSSLARKACGILFLVSTLSHCQPNQWCWDKRFDASGLVPVVCSIYPSDGVGGMCVYKTRHLYMIDWLICRITGSAAACSRTLQSFTWLLGRWYFWTNKRSRKRVTSYSDAKRTSWSKW